MLILHEATAAIGKWNLLAAAANAVGDVLFIALAGWGVVGAAVATCVSSVILLVGYGREARSRLGRYHAALRLHQKPRPLGSGFSKTSYTCLL